MTSKKEWARDLLHDCGRTMLDKGEEVVCPECGAPAGEPCGGHRARGQCGERLGEALGMTPEGAYFHMVREYHGVWRTEDVKDLVRWLAA